MLMRGTQTPQSAKVQSSLGVRAAAHDGSNALRSSLADAHTQDIKAQRTACSGTDAEHKRFLICGAGPPCERPSLQRGDLDI